MNTKQEIESFYSSPIIEKRLSEIKDRKGKNAFLKSIITDTSAVVLNETMGNKTILFSGNKGPKTNTWEQTKQMAFELNNNGIDVAFLPELLSEICADSLIRIGNIFLIADFKYCVTSKSNTLAKDLEHGFDQAKTIVLKLENMDFGLFKSSVDYLLRNEIPYGNIILINNYGKVLELSKRDIKTGIYKKKAQGFL